VDMSDTVSLVEDLRDAVGLAERIDLSESVLADIVVDLVVRHGYGGRFDELDLPKSGNAVDGQCGSFTTKDVECLTEKLRESISESNPFESDPMFSESFVIGQCDSEGPEADGDVVAVKKPIKKDIIEEFIELRRKWEEENKDNDRFKLPDVPLCPRYPYDPFDWYPGKPIWLIDLSRYPSFTYKITDTTSGYGVGLANTCSK